MSFPLLVKANIGGSGAGIVRFESREQLREGIGDRMIPTSVDRVLLLQDHVPARAGAIMRVETLGGKYLYALEVESGESFDLCPADACIAAPGKSAIKMRAVQPDQTIIEAVERIAQASELDVGGVELMIDDRDGQPRFYDINALSNFVANPIDVLGWEPHDRLVDYIVTKIAGIQRS
jgi:D-alanine-D-alanine ligase-like ATP-grasp enzyme